MAAPHPARLAHPSSRHAYFAMTAPLASFFTLFSCCTSSNALVLEVAVGNTYGATAAVQREHARVSSKTFHLLDRLCPSRPVVLSARLPCTEAAVVSPHMCDPGVLHKLACDGMMDAACASSHRWIVTLLCNACLTLVLVAGSIYPTALHSQLSASSAHLCTVSTSQSRP